MHFVGIQTVVKITWHCLLSWLPFDLLYSLRLFFSLQFIPLLLFCVSYLGDLSLRASLTLPMRNMSISFLVCINEKNRCHLPYVFFSQFLSLKILIVSYKIIALWTRDHKNYSCTNTIYSSLHSTISNRKLLLMFLARSIVRTLSPPFFTVVVNFDATKWIWRRS